MLAELERLGTIAAVARELRLTAPGVSMQLAALEREVGIQLTERHGRTVALTPAGTVLARHGRDIVDQLSVAELDAVALREGTAGTYRVAAFPSAARTIIAHAWSRLRAEPDLGLGLVLDELEPQDAIPALAAGRVDVAVVHSYSNMPTPDRPDLALDPIGTERVWLAEPDVVDGSDPRDPVDLGSYSVRDWIIPKRSLACFEMVARACGRAGFEPRAVAEATDFSAQLALVGAGVGVALVPELTIASLPVGVRLRSLTEPVYRYDFVATRRASQPDRGLRRLREVLADSADYFLDANRPAPVS